MALCLRLQDKENMLATMQYDNDYAKNDVCIYDVIMPMVIIITKMMIITMMMLIMNGTLSEVAGQ